MSDSKARLNKEIAELRVEANAAHKLAIELAQIIVDFNRDHPAVEIPLPKLPESYWRNILI